MPKFWTAAVAVTMSVLFAVSAPVAHAETAKPKPVTGGSTCDVKEGTRVSSEVKKDESGKFVINKVTGNQQIEIKMTGRVPDNRKAGYTVVVQLPAGVVMAKSSTEGVVKDIDGKREIAKLKTVPDSGELHIVFNSEVESDKCLKWAVAYMADYKGDGVDSGESAAEPGFFDANPWVLPVAAVVTLALLIGAAVIFLRKTRGRNGGRRAV